MQVFTDEYREHLKQRMRDQPAKSRDHHVFGSIAENAVRAEFRTLWQEVRAEKRAADGDGAAAGPAGGDADRGGQVPQTQKRSARKKRAKSTK